LLSFYTLLVFAWYVELFVTVDYYVD
jgi:hypothetical protein